MPLHQFEVYLSVFWFYLPATVFCTNITGYFILLSNAFFLITQVPSFIKIDYGTLKSLQVEDFMQISNPSAYQMLSGFYPPILAIAGVKTGHCP